MHWLYYFLMVVLLLVGLFGIILSLPGIWLMVAAVAGYAILTYPAYVGWKTVIALIVIGVLAEIVETAAGGAGAKRAGASKRGMIAAIVGGVIGAILGTFIPIPVVGTIFGACVGSLLFAAVTELLIGKEFQHSMRIGVGAAKGRFVGIVSKLGFGLLVMLIALWTCLPIGGTSAGPAPAPAPAPMLRAPATTTAPATLSTTVP